MDHGYFEDRISAYKDKGLPADEYELIRQHLAECESCRKLYERLEKFDRLVRDNAELGDDLYFENAAQKIEQRLGINQTVVTPIAKKSAWSGLGWKVTAAAASLVLIFIIAINKDKIFNEKQIMSPAPGITSPATSDTAESKMKTAPSEEKAVVVPKTEPVPSADSDELTDESGEGAAPADGGRMRRVDQVEKKTIAQEPERQVAPTTTANLPPPQTTPTERQQAPATSAARPVEPLPSAQSLSTGLQKTQSTDTKDTPAEVAQSQEVMRAPSPVTATAESATVDTVNQVRIAELESWRAVKDSLEPRLASTKAENRLFESMKPSSLQSERRGRPKLSAADIKAGLERQYLEACYQIARLASEPSEIQSAKDGLRKIAGDPSSPNRDTAQVLLERLAAGK